VPQSFFKQRVGLGSVLFGLAPILILAIVTVTNEALVPMALKWVGIISLTMLTLGLGMLWMARILERRINRRKKSN
jgi:nitrate reductase gamma subunit